MKATCLRDFAGTPGECELLLVVHEHYLLIYKLSDYFFSNTCTSSDVIYERKSQSRIYTNASSSVSYQHPPAVPATAKIAIVSATSGGGLDSAMHMSLSRMYYAHRHGYAYQHLVSEAYVNYFGDHFLDVSAARPVVVPPSSDLLAMICNRVFVPLLDVIRRDCPAWETPTPRT
jgi:hypothetical protein